MWEALMDHVVGMYEEADYSPGGTWLTAGTSTHAHRNMPPNADPDMEDPNEMDLGPLAYVLNEAMDCVVGSGADPEAIVEAVAQAAGENVTTDDVEAVLTGDNTDPDPALLRAFSSVLSIDLGLLTDAAIKGGATSLTEHIVSS